ncbi:MAG: hypothetical protein FJ266_12645 [Planctomycetes bacterium]|nr:hypothetical protein [Planctomycetota bacterium]
MVKKPEDWKWNSYSAIVGLRKTPEYLTINWILSQFGSKKQTAQIKYKEFVLQGMQKESPWSEIQGQIFLGEEEFVEKFKDLLADKEQIKEIPRHQRYAVNRLSENAAINKDKGNCVKVNTINKPESQDSKK